MSVVIEGRMGMTRAAQFTALRDAFTEFFTGKPEGVIGLPTTHCMVVKL